MLDNGIVALIISLTETIELNCVCNTDKTGLVATSSDTPRSKTDVGINGKYN